MNTDELITELRAEAGLCWAEGKNDIAILLKLAADELSRLRAIERRLNSLTEEENFYNWNRMEEA